MTIYPVIVIFCHNEEGKRMDVTVIVVCYNPEWKKMKKTLLSVVGQKNVNFDVIVADDGSKENYFEEVESFFESRKFSDFHLLSSKKNRGTCINIFEAMEHADGSYVKLISPGDYFYDEMTLCDWLMFHKNQNIKISFGNTKYYSTDENLVESYGRFLKNPRQINIYNKVNWSAKNSYLNYIFLNDQVVGASFLAETDLMKDYMKQIIGKIRFGEDEVYKKMLVDGIVICYFDRNVIWYEFGTGISTSDNSKWQKIYQEENESIYELIKNDNPLKGLEKKRLNWGLNAISKKRTRYFKFLIFPELIYWEVKKIIHKKYSGLCLDLSPWKE